MASQLLTSNTTTTFSSLTAIRAPRFANTSTQVRLSPSHSTTLHAHMDSHLRARSSQHPCEVGRTDNCQFPREMKTLSYRTVRGLLEEVMGRWRSGLPCTWSLPSHRLQYFASFFVNSSVPSILFPYFGYSAHQGFQNTSNLTPLCSLAFLHINRCPSTYCHIRSLWHRSKSPPSTSLSPPPRYLSVLALFGYNRYAFFHVMA